MQGRWTKAPGVGLWPRPGQSAQSFHSHRDWSADGLVIQFGSIRLNLRLSGKTEKKFSFCCTRRCKLSFSEILRETELTWRTVETSDREGAGPHDTLELLGLALPALPLNSFFKCVSTLSSFYYSGFSYLEFCAFFSSCHISRSLTATGIQQFNSIQFSSILTLPGVSADPMGWRAQSYNTDLTSDNSCKWGAQTSCPSAKLGDKFRSSHDPSGSITF